MGKFKEWFFKNDESDNSLDGLPAEVQQEMQESRAEFQKLQEENEQLKLAAKAKTTTETEVTEENDLETENKALSDKLDALSAEFAAFKKEAAADHTDTNSGDEAPDEEKPRAYKNTAINRRTVYRGEAK